VKTSSDRQIVTLSYEIGVAESNGVGDLSSLQPVVCLCAQV